MTIAPGTLLRSVDTIIGTGLPDGHNVIPENAICMFVAVCPFNNDHEHYRVLVLDHAGSPIVDDIIATKSEFRQWFKVV